MGLYISTLFETSNEDKIEDYLDKISETPKFNEYQEKFLNLVPARDVYLLDGELVIESIGNSFYSIDRVSYNWFDPRAIDQMYEHLDKLYSVYNKNL